MFQIVLINFVNQNDMKNYKKKIEFSLFKRAVENIRKFFVLITISNTSKNIIFSVSRIEMIYFSR